MQESSPFRRALGSMAIVLAVMLERKRILKQVKSEQTENGRMLIYEHAQTGDVFLVRDPQLRLDEIEQVQAEVVQLLNHAALAD